MKEEKTHLASLVSGFQQFYAAQYECTTCHRDIGHCYQKIVDEGVSPQRKLEWAIIGCADPRKPPEEIYNLKPGQALVYRNLGNSVPRTPRQDVAVWGAVAYAVGLGIKKIIIDGHDDCGAMKAAAYGHKDPILTQWRNQKVTFTRRLQAMPLQHRHDHASVLNVALSVRNIDRYLDQLVKEKGPDWERPTVTGLLFKMGEGNLYVVNRRDASLEPLTHHSLRTDRGHTPPVCPPLAPEWPIRPHHHQHGNGACLSHQEQPKSL